jgi:hypothetical protein
MLALQVIAEARKQRPGKPLAHADSFEPVVFVVVSLQDDVCSPIPVHIGEVDRGPLRHRGHIHVRLPEWHLSQHAHMRALVDNDDDLAEFHIGTNWALVIRRSQ